MAASGWRGIGVFVALAVLFYAPTASSPPSWAAPGRRRAASTCGSARPTAAPWSGLRLVLLGQPGVLGARRVRHLRGHRCARGVLARDQPHVGGAHRDRAAVARGRRGHPAATPHHLGEQRERGRQDRRPRGHRPRRPGAHAATRRREPSEGDRTGAGRRHRPRRHRRDPLQLLRLRGDELGRRRRRRRPAPRYPAHDPHRRPRHRVGAPVAGMAGILAALPLQGAFDRQRHRRRPASLVRARARRRRHRRLRRRHRPAAVHLCGHHDHLVHRRQSQHQRHRARPFCAGGVSGT